MIINDKPSIAIIGLGYVGLPLIVEFAKVFSTIGFDTNQSRIEELKSSYDSTLEVSSKELKQLSNVIYVCSESL